MLCRLRGRQMRKQAGRQTDSERKADRQKDCEFDMKKLQVYSQQLKFIDCTRLQAYQFLFIFEEIFNC